VSENNYDIYVMNSDGSDVQRITNDPAYDTHPSWSPDGNKISFVSAKDGNEEIYVMNTDGSDQTRLTNNLARDMNPSWSPDGDRIAFNSNLSDIDAGFGEDHEIYVMSTDGSNQIRLTKSPNNNGSPSWCADGSKIAFTSYLKDGYNDEIYVMNDDGTDLTRVTESIGIDAGPSWSPVISTTNP
jgi:Tol biopolymer transport system component